MKPLNVVWILLPLWWVAAPSILDSQTPRVEYRSKIVARSIELHGGSVYENSVVQLEVCSKSGCYQIESRIDEGLFDISAVGRVRDHERRVRITNDTLEYWQDGVLIDVSPDRAESLRDWVMARVYFVFLPFRLHDDSVLHEDLGIEHWRGEALRKVKVSFVPGSSSGAHDEFLYWFNPETARLEMFAYSFSGNPGGLRFRKAVNHRRVGGILFFDQENWGVDEDGLSVDGIDPVTVGGWKLVSKVRLQEIRVRRSDLAGGS
jgi:hypothetical protein